MDGKRVITLSRSSIEPFLQFSTRRDLREAAFKAWISRGENGGSTDNRAIIAEMVKLRAERAKLLGYDSFATFRLDDTMAKTPEAALDLLNSVWPKARDKAQRESEALQSLIQAEGGNFRLAPWDWRYYAEKRRKAEFDFDESALKPYLQLDRMIEAAFYTAEKLFGVSFKERSDVPVYHPDVRAWEVTGADGEPVGLFLGDYFGRTSKRSGAWMSNFRSQEKLAGEHPTDRRQRHEFLQGRRRLADAAQLRRRAHALPRVRPRAARASLRRDLSDDLRHERRDRLRGIPLAALRALAGGAGAASPLRPPREDRRADAGGDAETPA